MILIIATIVYLLYLVVHDLVPLYPLNDLHAVRGRLIGTRLATFAGNTLPVAVLLVIELSFPEGPLPLWASIYGGLYIVVFLILVWLSWYQPYFFGASEERDEEARREYGRTIQVLPDRGGRIRPNLLHLILHVIFFIVAVLFVLRVLG